MSSSGGKKKLLYAGVATGILLLLAILGVSIAALVTLKNNESNTSTNNQPSTTLAPQTGSNTVTTTGGSQSSVVSSSVSTTISNNNPIGSNPLNIPTPGTVSNNPTKKNAFDDVVGNLKASVDLTADPCNNFYQYSCGNYNDDMSFDKVALNNFKIMAGQIKKNGYITSNSPSAMITLQKYFNKCVDFETNYNKYLGDGSIVKTIYNTLQNNIKVPFPMMNQNGNLPNPPTSNDLGYLIGYLSGSFQTDTFITGSIDTNWEHPSKGYSFFIDQSTLTYSDTYYNKVWNTTDPEAVTYTISLINSLAKINNINLDQTKLSNDVNDIFNMEKMIASSMLTDDSTRRQYARSYIPMTASQASNQYPGFNFTAYLNAVTISGSNDVKNLINQDNFKFIIMEGKRLSQVLDALTNPQSGNYISPKIFYNYLYVRALSANSNWFPPTSVSQSNILEEFKSKRKHFSKYEGIIKNKKIRRRPRKHNNDISNNEIICAELSMDDMQYANARAFIDGMYPQTSDRVNIRDNVGKLITSILSGFQSMLDGLNWMTQETKNGAYKKINNLVKNIAFPDWIADDVQLSNYYNTLSFNDNDSYFDIEEKLAVFNSYTQLNYLLASQTNRIDFSGPPGTVNAWYQPEVNSISFPGAILQRPFYDVNYPASINYGAMGVIAGHELTHGFDDEGVQWNDVGRLSTWMDSTSKNNFTIMANCVVNEYSGFCPYQNEPCVDGKQTQGENIADNGGIHSAWRAYHNYVAFNGPDPRLDDPIFSQFTHDQLFFLSFAQVWCQVPPNENDMITQILVDPHSPSIYRVWGTVQNFPAFKKAFNCPDKSLYAPDQHCNVWVSDVNPSIGLPNNTGTLPDLNIPTPAVAPKTQTKYEEYAELLSKSIDLTKNPCDDFYGYACGNFNDEISFYKMDFNNYQTMAKGLLQNNLNDSNAVKKVKQFFNTCVQFSNNPDASKYNHKAAEGEYSTINQILKLNTMPLFSGKDVDMTLFTNPTKFAYIMGTISSQLSIDTMTPTFVDTNWKNPRGSQPYMVYVDQPSTYYPWNYYTSIAWPTIKETYGPTIEQTITIISKYFNQTTLDPGVLANFTQKMMNFELNIAHNMNVDDTTRRQYSPMYNLYTVSNATSQFNNFNFKILFSMMSSIDPNANKIVTNDSYIFSIAEPDKLNIVLNYMKNLNQEEANDFANYLYLRTFLNIMDNGYLNDIGEELFGDSYAFIEIDEREKIYKPIIGKPYRITVRSMKNYMKRQNIDNITQAQINCAGYTLQYMEYANARVFVDELYPTSDDKKKIREHVGKVANSILIGFRSMIDGLSWMENKSKKSAYDKIDNLVKNIAYPDFIVNDEELNNYYSKLSFDITNPDLNNYIGVLNQFNAQTQLDYITFTNGSHRNDFNGPPGTVNAWYQPELNSITFPAAILQPPFYDPEYPASVNFGSMGVVSGHELTHGFDDQGVQWNGVGELNPWIDDISKKSFQQMANCVINEYSSFCPLANTTYSPQCIIGAQTQGENIADNGGIHSAFRAYKAFTDFNGPDKRLPGSFASQYTHDQLFFLAFGQIWCRKPVSQQSTYHSLLTDVHSPAEFRVFGTIRNFPAFRIAFNCPLNSSEAPSDHCNVWVTDISSNTTTGNNAETNIPNAKIIYNSDNLNQYTPYSQAAEFYKYALNLTADPCNDFYNYACGSFQKPLSFNIYRDRNYEIISSSYDKLNNNSNTNIIPDAVKKAMTHYNACINARSNSSLTVGGNQILKKFDNFVKNTGIQFDIMKQTPSIFNSTLLGNVMGYLSSVEGINTFVTPNVDRDPDFDKYTLMFDQNTLVDGKLYYLGQTYSQFTKSSLVNSAINVFNNWLKLKGINVDSSIISNIANECVEFEYTLANQYSTDETTRRNFSRWNNRYSVGQLNSQFPFLDWNNFISQILSYADQTSIIKTISNVLIMEVEPIGNFGKQLQNGGFSNNLLSNYFLYRFLMANNFLLPQTTSINYKHFTHRNQVPLLGKINREDQKRQLQTIFIDKSISNGCAEENMWSLQYANARVFIDTIYPTSESRINIRNILSSYIKNIKTGFQSMIDQLEWMDNKSKVGAYAKISNLQVNLAYPDFITDDNKLNNYYQNLILPTDYIDMLTTLTKFNNYLFYSDLIRTSVDRSDFLSAPATVNAWYQPELNSISIPAGILQQPYFDPNWPASINYGAMGMITGHELTHGFDDQGVQWNEIGFLKGWMDDTSSAGFKEMAECVINEYNQFSPDSLRNITPNHVNGANTQGENIADNGGIHAGWRAYRNHIALNGPDPRLPDRLLSQYTHDQLYFLAFAQVWCQQPPTAAALQKQILSDVHSPSEYRIWGTLQNFPAFRTAFNCPAGSAYGPVDHCKKSMMNIEKPLQLLEPMNIPPRLLMGPGPSNMRNDIQESISKSLLGHLHPEFTKIMDDVREGIKYLFQTKNKLTFAVSGTGHAGMECALVNLLERDSKFLVIQNGLWGGRAASLAKRMGVDTKILEIENGKAATLEEFKKAINEYKPDVVFICHGESSTGVMHPLEGFGKVCHDNGALLLVDTVASIGGAPFKGDELGVDCVYSATQKVLNAPPSLAPISFSDKAVEHIKNRKTPVASFYFDALELGNYWGCYGEARRYHHTGMISMVYGLRTALGNIVKEGIDESVKRHEENAQILYKELNNIGLEPFVKDKNLRLPCLTTVKIPENVSWQKVIGCMMNENIEIAGGLGETLGKIWRIGTFGKNSNKEAIESVTKQLKICIDKNKN
uniref:alanine--glyoxylate transaminase n=1 Tax=Parastrongyloides trichosuri TaxID=131310 RepID=A0A0N5A694_PARTI